MSHSLTEAPTGSRLKRLEPQPSAGGARLPIVQIWPDAMRPHARHHWPRAADFRNLFCFQRAYPPPSRDLLSGVAAGLRAPPNKPPGPSSICQSLPPSFTFPLQCPPFHSLSAEWACTIPRRFMLLFRVTEPVPSLPPTAFGALLLGWCRETPTNGRRGGASFGRIGMDGWMDHGSCETRRGELSCSSCLTPVIVAPPGLPASAGFVCD